MKQFRNTFFMASLVIMAGCSSDDMNLTGGEPKTPLYELTTPLSIGSASLDEVVVTRGFSYLSEGDSIGLFLRGDGYTDINNRLYKRGPQTWGPTTAADTIYLGGGNTTITGYYPHSSTYNTVTTKNPSVALTTQPYNAKSDISFVKKESVNATTGNLLLQMSHIYSRLKIRVKHSSKYNGACVVTGMTLKQISWQDTFNFLTGEFSGKNGTGGCGPDPMSITVATNATKDYNDYLIIPCIPQKNGLEITLTVDGKNMTTTVPTANYTPKKGEYKSITLNIEGKAINFSVQTEDWPSPDNIGTFEPN